MPRRAAREWGASVLAGGSPAMTKDRLASAASDPDVELLTDVLRKIPGLRADVLEVSRLPGGLTNRNYRVDTVSHQVVVRLSSEQGALLAIDRAAEWSNSVAAAAAGVAPAVLGYLPSESALVIEWIDAETLTSADLDDSRTLAAVAAICRQLHAGPEFTGDFDMFALQRRYLDLVATRGYRLPPSYVDFLPQVDLIREAMAAHPVGVVPCHNDLLAANILRDAQRLWFIDFEYAGNGDPFFELGNLCSEALLGPDRLDELVSAYCGRESPAKTARARLHGLMSNYGWTLWASIQDATSELDFDFWSWGLGKYERAVSEFRGPDLAPLITAVRDDEPEGEGQ
jgi:thiamine kinase-like enzyme